MARPATADRRPGARQGSRHRPRRSRCAPAASAPMSSSASGEGSRSAPACPRAGRRTSIDLEKALALLSLPREVGKHPESGKPISAGLGRYGPFVQHDGDLRQSRDRSTTCSTIGVNRAVTVIAEKIAKGRGGRRGGAGGAEASSASIPTAAARSPCATAATAPTSTTARSTRRCRRARTRRRVTLEEAIALIAERAAKARQDGGEEGAAPRRRAAKKPKPPRRRQGAPRRRPPRKPRPRRPTASARPARWRPAAVSAQGQAPARRADKAREWPHRRRVSQPTARATSCASSRENPGPCRQARDRQGLRPEGRRPRLR